MLLSGPIQNSRYAVLVRLLIICLMLSFTVSLSGRGRTRGYQAGGGIHRNQPKQRTKKDKQPKKPSPPPEIKTVQLKPSN